jgi:peptidoglycan/LPS O-acetylase OafA/YrhL
VTFGEILDRNKGFGPGFDFARIALAFGVLAWHSPELVSGDRDYDQPPFWIFNYGILPMFFALSGFLVAASAQRLSFRAFFVNRGLRILPALAVEITLSALVLGAIFTALPLGQYFSAPKFWTYFLNITGWVHYRLPGVFEANPYAEIVNGSLWTVPHEMACYVVMALVIVSGLMRRPLVLLGFVVLYVMAGTLAQYLSLDVNSHQWALRKFVYVAQALDFHSGRNLYLVPSFCFGILLYAGRDSIAHSRTVAAGLLLGMVGLGVIGNGQWWNFGPLTLLVCPALAYLVVYCGLSPMPKLPFFSRGDYSYGVYLYAFPIQQALIAAFPAAWTWQSHLAVSALATTMFAYFSWHCIEKPTLRLRHSFAMAARDRSDLAAPLRDSGVIGRRFPGP